MKKINIHILKKIAQVLYNIKYKIANLIIRLTMEPN